LRIGGRCPQPFIRQYPVRIVGHHVSNSSGPSGVPFHKDALGPPCGSGNFKSRAALKGFRISADAREVASKLISRAGSAECSRERQQDHRARLNDAAGATEWNPVTTIRPSFRAARTPRWQDAPRAAA
jgi:hypothetical protein